MNAATVFSAPEFAAAIARLYAARDAALAEGAQALAEGYESLARQFEEGIHALRLADLES